MPPYEDYLEYKKQTKDIYKLLRHRINIYNQQQNDSGEPDRNILIRDLRHPDIRLEIPVNQYTTFTVVKQKITEVADPSLQLNSRDSFTLAKISNGRRETIYNWLCILDYELGDGDEVCIIHRIPKN